MRQHVQAEGGCLCGAVRFKVDGAPIRMVQCHCTDCQRASGSGHMPNVLFKEANVAVSGATSRYESLADSGNTLTRHFCPTCGGRLFLSSSARPGLLIMAAGAFDDSGWYTPELAIFTASARPWDPPPPDVPHHEAMPPAPSPKT